MKEQEKQDTCLLAKKGKSMNIYHSTDYQKYNEIHCDICGDYHDDYDSMPLSCKTGDGE